MANELCSSGKHKQIKITKAEAFGTNDTEALRALRLKIVKGAAAIKDKEKQFQCIADCNKTNCITLVTFDDKAALTFEGGTGEDPAKKGEFISGSLAKYKGNVTLTCHCEEPNVEFAMGAHENSGEAGQTSQEA
jgi:hypothetical protein